MQNYKSKVEIIYESLKKDIISGVYKPGDRIVISKVARENGVSEIPVREAIRMLETEDLVEIYPHIGPVVTEFKEADILETYLIRGVLEGFAARESIDYMTDEDIGELTKIIKHMKEALVSNNYVEYGILNRKFHNYITSINPHKRLYELINELWNKWERTRAVFVLSPERSGESLAEHEKIVELIKEKKYDELEMFVREHRRRAAESLIRSIKK
ncbi:GntR family transcriptional regulator [Thermosediminibacter litoriperuensis]|uniref:DNA-binding GntR family transcriptional regulator n=1 Tax=Thermosediminibacter litoriperuensis TaxID=291989 RepID=A0A5S5AJE3_9FIRM|nr:GntR family transcriptional regulator [Thermosediminibacter litoriperuensis]TYP49802.1 DNA-binding GntR family transcriptional regulator [Thermosediminibacter litoriperuensis]